MNSLDEIKEQSKFDCFARMYGYIAEAVMKAGGNRGERAVREAVIRYGEELGKRIRREILERGGHTDLAAMCRAQHCCGEDPRFCRHTVRDERESQMFEVYSCPMETAWRKTGCLRAGAIYCEECVHAAVRGYTGGKGQANLSNYMTCSRDFFCRFSVYLRPANLDEAQRRECFGEMEEEEPLAFGRTERDGNSSAARTGKAEKTKAKNACREEAEWKRETAFSTFEAVEKKTETGYTDGMVKMKDGYTGSTGEAKKPKVRNVYSEDTEQGKERGAFSIERNFLSLYRCLFDSARELLGMDGSAAVLAGLDRLCRDEERSLRLKAAHTGETLNQEFIRAYFPVLQEKGDSEAERLLSLHLTKRIFREANGPELRES